MSYELINADCLEAMRQMEECLVDAICTDPPAGINFMNRPFDSDRGGRKQWVAWLTEIMSEALRITKPGGHAFVWALPRTSHWTAWALEDGGWEIRDRVAHIVGNGFPKSKSMRDIGRPELGSVLKPAVEDWWLARRPLEESSISRQVLSTGTGALNIQASRVEGKRFPAHLLLSHHESCQRIGTKRVRGGTVVSHSKQSTINTYGEYKTRSDALGYTDSDGMEEVESFECVQGCPVALLDLQSGPRKSGGYPAAGGQRPHVATYGKPNERGEQRFGASEGGSSRFFQQFHEIDAGPGFLYQAKSSSSERNDFIKSLPRTKNKRKRYQQDLSKRWCARVKNQHPTIKPLGLCDWLVKLVCPPDGVVLDPFMGSGSIGCSAVRQGFNFIGIDQEAEYVTIAKRRLRHHAAEIEKVKAERLFA